MVMVNTLLSWDDYDDDHDEGDHDDEDDGEHDHDDADYDTVDDADDDDDEDDGEHGDDDADVDDQCGDDDGDDDVGEQHDDGGHLEKAKCIIGCWTAESSRLLYFGKRKLLHLSRASWMGRPNPS